MSIESTGSEGTTPRRRGRPANAARELIEISDRRRYPRIALEVPAHVELADGSVHVVRTRDVSPDGLQIACPRALAARILPPGYREGAPDAPRFKVRVPLPESPRCRAAPALLAECRPVYCILLSSDEAAIGVCFTRTSRRGAAVLEHFISAALVPDGEQP